MPLWGLLLLGLIAVGSWSCSSVRYMSQSLVGGSKVLLAREPIEKLLERGGDEQLQERLRLVQEIRLFAEEEMRLPVGKSYASYVQLDRDYVVWNVVAAARHSVVPETWCFPIAGCVSYRGYFSQRRAERFADSLRMQGLDVSVGGVTAYSTLGWFEDPVLSTFIWLPELRLAGLLVHEIAHRRLYVPGDTAFNESFASYVELEAERRWSERLPDATALLAEAALMRSRGESFTRLVLHTRDCLARVYARGIDESARERGRSIEFADLRARYASERKRWQEETPYGPHYDHWFEGELNNADIASVGDYTLWLDAFEALHQRHPDLKDFYGAVERLAQLDSEQRREALESLSPARVRSAEPCASEPLVELRAPDPESR